MVCSQETISQLLIYSKHWLYALIILFLGYTVNRYVTKKLVKNLKEKTTAQQLIIIKKSVSYSLSVVTIIVALQQIGLSLSGLLGVAGILSVAIGFAAQNSIANIISGLFLFFEQPFVIGDTIKIHDHIGQVKSIDLLSVKILKSDRSLLRVPNESMLKSDIINMSHIPTQR